MEVRAQRRTGSLCAGMAWQLVGLPAPVERSGEMAGICHFRIRGVLLAGHRVVRGYAGLEHMMRPWIRMEEGWGRTLKR